MLYDRPTLEWVNQECKKTSLILLGNGSIENEGKKLKQLCPNVRPWIFWPRRPMILEKIVPMQVAVPINTGSNVVSVHPSSLTKRTQ